MGIALMNKSFPEVEAAHCSEKGGKGEINLRCKGRFYACYTMIWACLISYNMIINAGPVLIGGMWEISFSVKWTQ